MQRSRRDPARAVTTAALLLSALMWVPAVSVPRATAGYDRSCAIRRIGGVAGRIRVALQGAKRASVVDLALPGAAARRHR